MDKAVRKALEKALKDVIDALPADQRPKVQWPNIAFDDSKVPEYIRPTFHPGTQRPKTLGPNPRTEVNGVFKVGVFVRPGTGPDRLDDLVDLVISAYPYGTDLNAGGRAIQIDAVDKGDLITPPNWAYKPVDIRWSIRS